MRRWRGCTPTSSRSTKSSTTTSRGPSPTATSRCTRGARGRRTASAGKPIEIQIRTEEMHDHAEHGVAAHWAYKEARPRATRASGPAANTTPRSRCCGSCWPGSAISRVASRGQALFDDRIYVLTPDAAIVELPQGATPVDFAYTVHTSARAIAAAARASTARWCRSTRRCRTARRSRSSRPRKAGRRATGSMPSWATSASHRHARRCAPGSTHKSRTRPSRAAARRSRSCCSARARRHVKLDDLASQLGFKSADHLFEVVGKDEFSLRNIEMLLRPPEPAPGAGRRRASSRRRAAARSQGKGGVLVVGVFVADDPARQCCKPAPPDAIRGFVTRGHGVSVHRTDCSNFRTMAAKDGERAIDVEWGAQKGARRGRSTRWTWLSRRPTGRACCATSPTCWHARR